MVDPQGELSEGQRREAMGKHKHRQMQAHMEAQAAARVAGGGARGPAPAHAAAQAQAVLALVTARDLGGCYWYGGRRGGVGGET